MMLLMCHFFVSFISRFLLGHINFAVLNFFSLPIDDEECLTEDGRRIGMCMNVYECRIQGNLSSHKLGIVNLQQHFNFNSLLSIRRNISW